jgi:hypothetical protein
VSLWAALTSAFIPTCGDLGRQRPCLSHFLVRLRPRCPTYAQAWRDVTLPTFLQPYADEGARGSVVVEALCCRKSRVRDPMRSLFFLRNSSSRTRPRGLPGLWQKWLPEK